MTISLISPALARAGFSHGFSTREVDLRFDAPDYAGSLRRFGTAAGIDPLRLAQARQVHGIHVVDAQTTLWIAGVAPATEADAIVAEPGYAAGVRVADCVPILVGDPTTGQVAAIHAGWRGLVAGVIQAALARLSAGGADLARSVAAIGPCICATCFEVGDDVAERITHAVDASVVETSPPRKPHANLRLGARRVLERVGVGGIEDVPGCTRCEKDRFFSYRRDQDASGRHLAAIAAGTTSGSLTS
ncbi:polyphenol oxidase family protein [Pendulispora rubella]|uniref:Polyphenol oxidase family protein n=1 Tax=Pendulispora rubella TaxID=2741070 RepID=A0ABZ2KYZ6_9BACT